MTRTLFAALATFLGMPATLCADSYLPFGNFRQVDPTGKYYLVVKKVRDDITGDPGRGTEVSFEFVRRQSGTPRLQDESDRRNGWQVVPNSDVKVRAGDIVLGRGELKRCPSLLLISSTGLGFAGLGVRGYNFGLRRSGDAIVIVGRDGKVRHRKDLIDLFSDAEINRFTRTAGGVRWLGGGWIDERRREVIVVGATDGTDRKPIPRLLRTVSMDTGKVSAGSNREIIAALADVNRGALDLALDLVAELKCTDALNHLAATLASDSLPKTTRLRSAVALGALGDKRGADIMTRAALELDKAGDAQGYALQQLPKVLGDKAAAVLCEAVRRHGEDAWFARDGMRLVAGEAAVPELIRLLEERCSVAAQEFAAECLGYHGSAAKPAVPSLIRLLRGEPRRRDGARSTPEMAAFALGEIGPAAKDALPLLTRWAEVNAKAELERVKNIVVRDDPQSDQFRSWNRYSKDWFVDAICKIRRK